jgi:MFS family permease
MAGTRRWPALVLLCAAGFMVILDAQIVVLALPSIERALSFAGGGAQWVLTAYLLSFGGLLLFGGRAGDLLGRRRVFLAGTALFLVSSLLCGLAWTGVVLVAARVLQGMSSAAMAPAALSILLTTFPEGRERSRALAVWSGTGGFGATVALLVGGGLTGLGWQWIFFVNVPVAAVLLALGPVLLMESRDRGRVEAFDLAGAVTVTAALAVGILAVVGAPDAGWAGPRTLGLLALSGGLFALFAWIENRSAAPLVPLRLFRSRALIGGNFVTVSAALCVFGMSFAMTQYAQRVLGYSPLVFGLATAIMPVMSVVGAYLGHAAVTRAGARPVAVAGLLLIGVGCVLLSRVSADGTYLADLFPGLVIFGTGLGLASVAGPVAALSGVAEAGVASGINTAAFQIGGALGVAVASTVVFGHVGAATDPQTLTSGFRLSFGVSAGFAALGLAVAMSTLGRSRTEPAVAETR